MDFVIIIPARIKSSRFPEKPLAKINDEPLIFHVLKKCQKVIDKSKIYVATDSKKIFNEIIKRDYNCVMTSKRHLTGTDRVAEVSQTIKSDIYINVQGDEPLINPISIKKIIKEKKKIINK